MVGAPRDQGSGHLCLCHPDRRGGAEPRAVHKEVKRGCARRQGAIATPGRDPLGRGLPKTRSGKIMRRILRKIATGETDSLGISPPPADPGVVDKLIREKSEAA